MPSSPAERDEFLAAYPIIVEVMAKEVVSLSGVNQHRALRWIVKDLEDRLEEMLDYDDRNKEAADRLKAIMDREYK